MRRDYGQGETARETGRPRRARRRTSGDGQTISIAEIETLDRAALSALWRDLFGCAVPVQMSQPILRRFISFEIQARAEGGLPASVVTRLARIASGDERKATPDLRPGSRLLREWNGTTHVVDVTADGFLWNGAHHRSLSAIAREITGARWSGPRFFGLTVANEAPRKKKERSS